MDILRTRRAAGRKYRRSQTPIRARERPSNTSNSKAPSGPVDLRPSYRRSRTSGTGKVRPAGAPRWKLTPKAFVAGMMNCADSPFDYIWAGHNDDSMPYLDVNLLRDSIKDWEDLFASKRRSISDCRLTRGAALRSRQLLQELQLPQPPRTRRGNKERDRNRIAENRFHSRRRHTPEGSAEACAGSCLVTGGVPGPVDWSHGALPRPPLQHRLYRQKPAADQDTALPAPMHSPRDVMRSQRRVGRSSWPDNGLADGFRSRLFRFSDLPSPPAKEVHLQTWNSGS